MNRFLSAKHWVLFVLSFGLPFVFQMIMMARIFVNVAQGNVDISGPFMFFPVMMILYVGTMFGWFWAVGIKLQAYLPDSLKIKTGLFKAFFFIPLIYIISIMLVIGTILMPMFNRGYEMGASPDVALGMFMLIIPLHLFSMFCIFYCLYFVAKTLKTVELQKQVAFGDFVGEFFLVWFFPIGIWFLQPRINKIVEEKEQWEQ